MIFNELIFYHDPRILFFSVHQSPAYPGTGAADEVGASKGKGYTINVPLPPYTGDDDYELIFREILVPVCDEYKPQMVIVSSGYDAHQNDPLAGMVLSSQAYKLMESLKKIEIGQICLSAAASNYGGEDFACVLGQEMAGYATGPIFFVSQAMGFRHS
ncbi:MAG: hypothetical protein Q7I94_07365, partial [Candidatus Contubernalis sp.]|nr:hypothetical protein [Candidatus Contubernalis sp.]